mmetsp:Transcript_310/g.1032  ORF Transcript_310/g.1032 Transcript_310/m.1032 type:complete len:395 (-) Transcript_310:546-1730(-)
MPTSANWAVMVAVAGLRLNSTTTNEPPERGPAQTSCAPGATSWKTERQMSVEDASLMPLVMRPVVASYDHCWEGGSGDWHGSVCTLYMCAPAATAASLREVAVSPAVRHCWSSLLVIAPAALSAHSSFSPWQSPPRGLASAGAPRAARTAAERDLRGLSFVWQGYTETLSPSTPLSHSSISRQRPSALVVMRVPLTSHACHEGTSGSQGAATVLVAPRARMASTALGWATAWPGWGRGSNAASTAASPNDGVPDEATRRACTPSWSWLIAMISLLVRMLVVAADMVVTSQPMSMGALDAAHSVKCEVYSSVVIPPLPTSSMSGSFQPPGPAYGHRGSLRSRREVMDDHESEMSPVVRQLLPTLAAQSQGSCCPHSHMEKKMARPDVLSASRMTG